VLDLLSNRQGMTNEEKKKEAIKNAYKFWEEQISKNEQAYNIYVAGVQWMRDYWAKKENETE
jgi:hypothetical protein